MARKPADQISSLQTRDALWAAIRNFGRPFTARELRIETRCTTSQTGEYLIGLTAAGILSAHQETGSGVPHPAKIYTLVNDCGIEAPRVRRDGSEVTQGRGREQLWETMRIFSSFSSADLAVFASTEEHPVAAGEARIYCATLAAAGYLRKHANGTYTLIKRTGPKPPQIQRTKQVYDPNLGEIVWKEQVSA